MTTTRHDRRIAPSNYGTRASFPFVPVAGGFSANNNVQLISARANQPTQWCVTLQPLNNFGAQQVPWFAPWDGTATVLPNPGSVPIVGPSTPYRVTLEWGAGGVRSSAVFDYPYAGGVFGIVADTLDLNVADPTNGSTVYASTAEIPVFGAFMVPGSPTNPAPMHMTEVPSGALAAGAQVVYSIKPYSRGLWVSQLIPANAAVRYSVEFLDLAGTPLWATYRAVDGDSVPQPMPVPGGSVLVRITNLTAGGAGQQFRPLWEMGFS